MKPWFIGACLMRRLLTPATAADQPIREERVFSHGEPEHACHDAEIASRGIVAMHAHDLARRAERGLGLEEELGRACPGEFADLGHSLQACHRIEWPIHDGQAIPRGAVAVRP